MTFHPPAENADLLSRAFYPNEFTLAKTVPPGRYYPNGYTLA